MRRLFYFITLTSLLLSTGIAKNALCNPPTNSSSPTITSFTPASGPVGTLVTITGTNLSSPTAFTIGGTAAIVISNSGTTLVGFVMPGSVTGIISITTAGGTATSSGNFTVIPTPYPAVQQGTKLIGTGAVGAAEQGNTVAVSADGNTAIVGGGWDNSGQGAVWVFTRSGSVWSQQGSKLVGTGATGSPLYQGYSVALSADGNTAIVGAPFDNSHIGATWVFTRSGTTWSQQGSKLVGTGNIGIAWQGNSVAVSADGNTAIVGGPYDNYIQGAVWVFSRSGSTWTQQGSKLLGTGNTGNIGQGTSVSISADGNTLIEGSDADNMNQGAAWIFTRSGTTWSQQGNKLVGTGNTGAAWQGSSVALSADGNTAIEGGWNDNNGHGAAWVFTRSAGAWSQQDKLVGTGAVGAANQGMSVSLSADGNTAIEGGYFDNYGPGATWVFTRSGTTWNQQGSKLVGTGAVGSFAGQGLSMSLSADGSTAIEGGSGDNNNHGAAWVFVPPTCADPTNGGAIASSQTICQGSSPSAFTSTADPSTYIGTMEYKWQYSVSPFTTWTDIAGSNSNTYASGALSVITEFQRLARVNCMSDWSGAATSNILTVVVIPIPVPTITGQNSLCVNSGYYNYTTESGMTNYVWNISSGGIINFGLGTNQIQVSWIGTGAQTVSVTYSNGSCNAAAPTILNVTVNPLPDLAGSITGTDTVCAGANGIYSVAPINGASAYVWTLPANASIASGNGTNSITVNFGLNAVSGNITVFGNNLCGNGPVSPAFPVFVNSIPPTPVVTNTGTTLFSSAPAGNQWYFAGTLIPGATAQTYVATQDGLYWTIVTINACSSAESNHLQIFTTGIEFHSPVEINVYPVPNDGRFNVSFTTPSNEFFTISIINNLGIKVYEEVNVEVNGVLVKGIDLKSIPNGVYTVIFESSQNQVVKKIVVNR